jgi:hypothetical protein
LSGWLFVPKREEAPRPAITMVHGNVGTKYDGLEPMAEALPRRGSWCFCNETEQRAPIALSAHLDSY